VALGCAAGRRTVKQDPSPAADSTSIVPPIASVLRSPLDESFFISRFGRRRRWYEEPVSFEKPKISGSRAITFVAAALIALAVVVMLVGCGGKGGGY